MSKGDTYFADSIRTIRAEHSLSQQQLAEILGVGKTTICNYESCYSTPNMSIYKKLCAYFNKPMTFFTQEKMEKNRLSEKIHCSKIFGTVIPFFNSSNIEGLRTSDKFLQDSIFTIPSAFFTSRDSFIATTAPDNSMNKCGIRCGDAIIIDTGLKPYDMSIIAAIHRSSLIIRRYHNDVYGTYLSCESTKVPPKLSEEEIPKSNFKIIGTISNLFVNAKNI